jgi:hypothetical protein
MLPLRDMVGMEANRMATGQGPQSVQVPLTWVGAEELPITFISHFLGQVDDKGDAILTFGQTTPPALLGSPEEVLAQAQRLAYVPVRPVARFSLSRPRLLELLEVVRQTIELQQVTRGTMRQAGLGETL